MPYIALNLSAKRALIALLLLLQIGFVNGETLLMAAANIEHHALFSIEDNDHAQSTSELAHNAFDSAQPHDTGSHHCDICHGHSAHFALTADKDMIELQFSAVQQTLPSTNYHSCNLGSIYRPPILTA